MSEVTAGQPSPTVPVAVGDEITVGANEEVGVWLSGSGERVAVGPGDRTGPVWTGEGDGLAVVGPPGRGDWPGGGGAVAFGLQYLPSMFGGQVLLGVGVGLGLEVDLVGDGVDVDVLGVVGVPGVPGVLGVPGVPGVPGFSLVLRGGAVIPALPQSARTEASQ